MSNFSLYIIGVSEDIAIHKDINEFFVNKSCKTVWWKSSKEFGRQTDEIQYEEWNKLSDFVLIVVSTSFESKYQSYDLNLELNVASKWNIKSTSLYGKSVPNYQRCFVVTLDNISDYSDAFKKRVRDFSNMTNFDNHAGLSPIQQQMQKIFENMKEMFNASVNNIFSNMNRELKIYTEESTLSEVMFDYYELKIRHFPIVVEKPSKELFGLISLRNLLKFFPPEKRVQEALKKKLSKKIDFDDIDLDATTLKEIEKTKAIKLITANESTKVIEAIKNLSEKQQIDDYFGYISSIPIVDGRKIKNIISYTDALRYSSGILSSLRIEDCMKKKQEGHKMISAKSTDTLKSASTKMKNEEVRHLIITDANDKPLGMISDYKVIHNLKGDYSQDITVDMVMEYFRDYRDGVSKGSLPRLKKEEPVSNFVEVVLERKLIGGLPVFDKDLEDVVGFISYTDVLSTIYKEVSK